MLNRFRSLVVGPAPEDDDPPPEDPLKPGLVYDAAEASWIAGFIPTSDTLRYQYTRPEFLLLSSDDEIDLSGDQMTRPVLVPKDVTRIPLFAGYAETINAGKTRQNEDQAVARFLQVMSRCTGEPRATLAKQQMPLKEAQPQQTREKLISLSSSTSQPHPEPDADDLSPTTELADSASESDLTRSISEDRIERTRHLSDDEEILVPEEIDVNIRESEDTCRADAFLFGIFDGHAGTGAALAAAACLHEHIKSKLSNVLDLALQLEKQEEILSYRARGVFSGGPFVRNAAVDAQQANFMGYSVSSPQSPMLAFGTMAGKKLTRDALIMGALETAFAEMDDQIGEEKVMWRVPGGCASLVALVYRSRVYIANSGDCRALAVLSDGTVQPMSVDHTPATERARLQHLAFMQPELSARYHSRLEYSRRLTRKDMRRRVLYRDWFMNGWSLKMVTEADLRQPLISSCTTRPRLLNTIGVSRGFGDHHLVTYDYGVPIKPFISCVPEVSVLDLEQLATLDERDVLVLASDGLWDVLSNDQVAANVQASLAQYAADDVMKYTLAAQDLVVYARGERDPSQHRNRWRIGTTPPSQASTDDISVFIIPLHYALNPPPNDEDDDEALLDA